MGAIMGGNVRVGLEDNIYLGKGELAKSSAEQVRKICRILKELSLDVATPDEAREMLQLKGAGSSFVLTHTPPKRWPGSNHPRKVTIVEKSPIAVIGAGLMGHGIAQVFAVHGHPVHVYDRSPDALASLQGKIRTNLRDLEQDPSAADLVTPCSELAHAVREAGVVFEAGPENLDLKRDLFQLVEQAAPEDALLASNTSVIPLPRSWPVCGARGGHSVRTGGTRHTSCPWSKSFRLNTRIRMPSRR